MADEILGISAQIDISDIEKTFSQLSSELDKIGVQTKEASGKITKALNDISASATDTEKASSAIRALKEGIEEINKSLASSPASLKQLSAEAQNAETTVEKLKNRLAQTAEGSKDWQALNLQLQNQQKLAGRLNEEYNGLLTTFGNAQQHIGLLNATVETLNAGRSISTAVTGSSAIAHSAATAAIVAESAAHTDNATKISAETSAMQQNVSVAKELSLTVQQNAVATVAEMQAVEQAIEKLKNGNLSTEEYSRTVSYLTDRIAALNEEASKYREIAGKYLLGESLSTVEWSVWKDENSNPVSKATTDIESGNKAKQRSIEIEEAAMSVSAALRQLQKEYESLNKIQQQSQQSAQETAQKSQSSANAEIQAQQKVTDIIRQKEAELKKYEEQIEIIEAHQQKGWGGEFMTSVRAGENPLKAVKEYFAEGDSLKEQKQKAEELREEIERLQEVYRGLSVAEKQQTQGSQAQVSTQEKIRSAIESTTAELQRNKEVLQQLESQHSKLGMAWSVVTDVTTGVNPAETIDAYKQQSAVIEETKESISELEEKLSQLNAAYAEISGSATDAGQSAKQAAKEMSAEDVYHSLVENEKELKIIKDEYHNIVAAHGKSSEAALRNKEAQKELNTEIAAGKEKLAEMGTSYKEMAEQAKKAAKETGEIEKKTESATKKISGMASSLKSAFSGALKGDFSGLFGLVGKIGALGAAIATAGKGLYELTVRAERFRASLQPLSHYLGEDVLKDVRQNILALSSTTTKSVADMASAAVQFSKAWDSLRTSPQALTIMIKAANEFGAITGKTSEESAKELSKIASMYHLTAKEATDVSTIVAAAAHDSVSSVGEMSIALSSAGTTASMYGVSFRDMAAMIGYSANNFGGASNAASKFSMMLMTMSNLQKEYNPRMVGLVEALKNLKEAYDRGEPVQDKFMKRNRAAAMYFINNADAIAKYSKGLDDNKAKNELLADASTRASVNVSKLKNAWDGFLTSINANFTPILTNVLNFFNRIIGGAQKTADELNYLRNYNQRHNNKKNQNYVGGVVDGFEGFSESSMMMRGAAEMDKPNLDAYRGQRDKLYKFYDKALEQARKKYTKASAKALANIANSATLRYYNKNKKDFGAIAAGDFNDLIVRGKRNESISLLTKPKNSEQTDNDYKITDTTKDKEAKKQAEEAAKRREQLAEEQRKWNEQQAKIKQQASNASADVEVARIKNEGERKREENRRQHEKNLQQIEEQANEYRKATFEHNKKLWEISNTDKTKSYEDTAEGKAGWKGVSLTKDQQTIISAAKEQETLDYSKKQEEIAKQTYKAEFAAMQDYLKQYGTLQEQKLAIDREYAEKRKEILDSSDTDEQKQWQLRSLEAQHSADTSKLNFDIFKNTIDWDGLFNEMTSLTKAQLEGVKEQLTDLMKSGTLGLEQYKDVLEQIRAIDEELNARDNNPWRTAHSQERDRLEQNVTTSRGALSDAINEQTFAKFAEFSLKEVISQILSSMGINVQQQDITTENSKNIIGKVSSAYGADSKETKQVQDAFARLSKSSIRVADSNLKVDAASKRLASDERKLSSFTKNLYESLQGVVEAMEQVTTNLNDLPGLLGELGVDEESDTMKGAQDMANAGNSAISAVKDYMTGNYIGAAMNGISAVKSFGSGLNNLLGLGIGEGNAKEINEKIEDLTERNDLLIDALDRLTDQLNDTTGGMKSIKTAQEAQSYQKEKEDNLKEMARLRSTYTAAHHSWAYNWEGFTDEQIKSFSEKIGRSWSGNIWDLTTDEIADLMATPDMVEKIKNTGNSLYANTLIEYLNAWADEAGAMDEISDTLKEKLTQTTFDSLRSDFLDTLMDMDSDAEDFTERFTEMLMQSVLNAKMADLLDDDMQAFYDKWSEYAESDGKLTNAEIANLRADYDALTAKALELRDQAAQITGYEGSDSDADSSTGAWSSLGEETGRALEGRFAALQIQTTKIADFVEQDVINNSATLLGLTVATQQATEVLSAIQVDSASIKIDANAIKISATELVDIQYSSLNRLEDIVANTAFLPKINNVLSNIYDKVKSI